MDEETTTTEVEIPYDRYKRTLTIYKDYLYYKISRKDLSVKYGLSLHTVDQMGQKALRAKELNEKKRRLYSMFCSKEYTLNQLMVMFDISLSTLKKWIRETDIVVKYEQKVPIKSILEHYDMSMDDFEFIMYKYCIYPYFEKTHNYGRHYDN